MPVTNLFTLKHECYPNIKVASPKFLHDMLISTQNHVALVKLVNPNHSKTMTDMMTHHLNRPALW